MSINNSKIMKVLNILDIFDALDKLSDIDDDDDEADKVCIDNTLEYMNRKMSILKANEPQQKRFCIDVTNPLRGLKDAENPLERFTNEEFLAKYRFTKETVQDILNMILYGLTKYTNRGHPVPPIIELLITLRFLATGEFQIKNEANVSQPTVSRIIKKITTLLAELKLRFIKFPEKSEHNKISETFYKTAGFPEVFGCLGSTHIGIKCPGKALAEGYLNEKGYYSIHCQIICGPNWEFFDIISRWPGSTHENKIFNISEVRQRFEYHQLEGVLLANNNYSPCSFVMTPIHELMLRDTARQEAYRNAIFANKELFHGRTVLDVGAGTGILSIFCAQAGATKVFAVEVSNLANIAKKVIEENDFHNIIEVFQSSIEEFVLPEHIDKVDIIISEWMGFYLLHEGMLDSLIVARDKFLKSNGTMFPESASIIVAPCRVPEQFDDWEDMTGVKMTTFADQLRLQKSQKPEIMIVNPSHLLSDGEILCWIDLNDVSKEDINEFTFKELIVTQQGGKFQGVCIWFECTFPSVGSQSPVVLSTSPKCTPTHWKQTVIVLPKTSVIDVIPKEPLAFSLLLQRSSDNQRRYNLQLELLDTVKIDHPLPCNCLLTKCILAKAHLEKMELMQED